MKPKEVKRIYNGSDAFMLQEARVIYGLLNSDLARFTSFDSTFNNASQTGFLALITAAETVVDDAAVVSQMKQSKELLVTTMEAAKTKYGELKYYAIKAFPNSPATQEEFGINEYENARKSAMKMVGFLDELSKAATKYQAQLVAAGCSVATITAIATLRTDLLAKNTTQKTSKRNRPKLTEDRIIILNNCYSRMTLVNSAAQIVYAADYAKQKQFVYRPSKDNHSDIENFIGMVSAGHTLVAGEIEYDEDNVFTFKNTGASELVFCLSATGDVEGTTVSVTAGTEQTFTASQLNANAAKIVVKNIGNDSGSYEIDVER